MPEGTSDVSGLRKMAVPLRSLSKKNKITNKINMLYIIDFIGYFYLFDFIVFFCWVAPARQSLVYFHAGGP